MKTGEMKFGLTLLFILVLAWTGNMNGQENKTGNKMYFSNTSDTKEKKLTREEKKELKKKEQERSFVAIDSLVTSRRFVLEADFLQGRSGERVFVNSTINFVRVAGRNATVQVGNNTGVGANGVGGETAEGELTNWNLTRNMKNRTITVRFSIESALGHFDIMLRATSGNQSEATITGLGSGMITWIGHLKPIEFSRVFQGQTNY